MSKTLSVLTNQEVRHAINSYHESNRLSLEIVNVLRQQFDYLAEHYGPIGNILGLFFHDLIVHFSGIVIQREFIRGQESEPIAFPFVSASYARQPFLIEMAPYLDQIQQPSSVRSFWRTKGVVPIAAGDAVPFDFHSQWLSRKSFTLLTKYQPFVKTYLPNREHQVDTLSASVCALAERFEIPKVDHLIKNWKSYARYHTSTTQSMHKERGLILGTRVELQNRKLAINFLQQDKPVVGMTHGEITNTIFNEPLFGYAESGLCSTLIDYGDVRLRTPLNKPLTQPKRILARTSMPVQRIRKKSEKNWKVRKISNGYLYIPTLYNGAQHYGPYRSFEDSLYVRWQSELISAVPDIAIKPHPKSIPPSFEVKRDHRNLDRCYADYDTIILDYYSTAATLMISTHKPVIYFDIGLRNLAPDFQWVLEQRCHYVKIDWGGDLRDQIRQTLGEISNSRSFREGSDLAPFSIASQSSSKLPSIFEVLHEGLG